MGVRGQRAGLVVVARGSVRNDDKSCNDVFLPDEAESSFNLCRYGPGVIGTISSSCGARYGKRIILHPEVSNQHTSLPSKAGTRRVALSNHLGKKGLSFKTSKPWDPVKRREYPRGYRIAHSHKHD